LRIVTIQNNVTLGKTIRIGKNWVEEFISLSYERDRGVDQAGKGLGYGAEIKLPEMPVEKRGYLILGSTQKIEVTPGRGLVGGGDGEYLRWKDRKEESSNGMWRRPVKERVKVKAVQVRC